MDRLALEVQTRNQCLIADHLYLRYGVPFLDALEADREGKGCAFTLVWFDTNSPIEMLTDSLRDQQPKSDTLLVDMKRLLELAKHLKEIDHLFLGDPNSCVNHIND